MTRIVIRAFGLVEAETRFTRMGQAAINARPALLVVAEEIRRIIRVSFESGGRRAGGSWKQDSPGWLRSKMIMGGDPRVGFFTGDLFRSYTHPGAHGSILSIGPRHVNVGSSLKYARTQQKHRPVWLIPSDHVKMRMIIRDYLLVTWKTAVKI